MHIEFWVLAMLVALAAVGLFSIVRGVVRSLRRREELTKAVAAMKQIAGGTDKELRAELRAALKRQREELGLWI